MFFCNSRIIISKKQIFIIFIESNLLGLPYKAGLILLSPQRAKNPGVTLKYFTKEQRVAIVVIRHNAVGG